MAGGEGSVYGINSRFAIQEIADKLFVRATTVDTHRKNLLAKLEVPNVAALVKTAMKLRSLGD